MKVVERLGVALAAACPRMAQAAGLVGRRESASRSVRISAVCPYSAASGIAAASARSHTAVSWNTAPPAGGAGSSLVSALMPMPPS